MPPEYTTSTDVYRHAGIDSTVIPTADIDEHILDAEAWIDNYLQTTFKSGGRTFTETRDGNNEDFIVLERCGKQFIDANPILTVNSLTVDGTTVTPGSLFVYKDTGMVSLGDTSEVSYFKALNPQSVVIEYVYGHDAIPRVINQITAIYAAISALVEQIGGTFDDVTSYQLPELSASKGEPFTNIRETVVRLINKLEGLLSKVRPVAYMG